MEDKSGRESKKRLWDTGRYLVGCLLLLCMAGKSYAQGDDFGVWTSAEVKKKIFSGFDASLEGEFRTRDGLQTVERWSGFPFVNGGNILIVPVSRSPNSMVMTGV